MASAGSGKKKSELEVVSVELPAPEGWVKKFIPKQGGTPRRNEVVFISPSGEEIKNRRQLDQFLRSHPGGLPSSSFDWGTGDTPRRSARISEKVKVLPEVEKPKRASRSSEKLKSLPEVEKNKLDSSSGLQKGTKRSKNTEYSGDEAEGEADEGDGSKCGDKENVKGLKKGKRRKKTTEDEGHRALGESPKDVDMEEAKGTKLTKHAEGNVEEGVELPIESEIAIENELADKAEKNGDDKIEQDLEFLEGRGKDFKEAMDDTEVSPTAAADSEKVALIEKNDTPKDVDMEAESSMHNNAKDEATSEGSHGIVEDESIDKTDENIEENAEQPKEIPGEFKHELADKERENDDMEEAKGTVNNKSKEAVGEEVFGLVKPELNDKTEKNALENVELPAQSQCAIKHEFAVRIKENVEESVEIKHKLAHKTKDNVKDNVKQNVEVDQDLELLEGKETELEPVQQVEVDKLIITGVSSDSDKVALIHMDDQAPAAKKDEDAETSGNGRNKEKEVKTAPSNKFEHGKEIKESTNEAKALQAASDSEKVFFTEQHVGASAAKNDEASVCINKESVTLSENGGKGEGEEIAPLDDFLHDYDEENMRIEPSPSNW